MGAMKSLRVLGAALAVLAMALPAIADTTAVNAGPYVPTPHAIADRMLALANIGSDDYLIDLGSGDGRLVLAAVARYNARGAAGIEIDAGLVRQASDEARNAGLADRATFHAGDLFAADVSKATVVTLYLLPHIMGQVEQKLGKELKPGTRVVSHDYSLPTWKPLDSITFDSDEKVHISGTRRTVLYLYRVPER